MMVSFRQPCVTAIRGVGTVPGRSPEPPGRSVHESEVTAGAHACPENRAHQGANHSLAQDAGKEDENAGGAVDGGSRFGP